MPPYYPDQYQNGMPNQPYYPNYGQPQAAEQVPRQYVQQPPQSQIQVNIPPRPPQTYSQPPAHYQYPQGQPPFNHHNNPMGPVQYYNPQSYAYNNNNQYQQQYQPPPPVRVIVPPLPFQTNQTNRSSIPQPPIQPPTSIPVTRPPQPVQSPPQPQLIHTSPQPPFRQQPQPQPRQQHQPLPQPAPQPRVLQEQPNVAKPPANSTPKSTPIPTPKVANEKSTQNPAILLALADEYIDAARKLDERTEDYHILMSTAMGCLQVTLGNFKLTPLRSAQLSLKYAQLLYDETSNLDDAEIVLTKSIELCERMKYIDLKYAMQLLLAKILFRSKPRAAVRDLESMIQDIETYKHTAWEYPFRFQAIFFLLESTNNHNYHESLQHLDKIQQTAHLYSDRAIYAFAAILESLLHLRIPGSESLSHSQQALAKARSLQLNTDVERHPQMTVMMEFIDLMWALNTVIDPKVLDQKRTNLKDALYASIDGQGWSKDESTWLRVNTKSLKGMPTQIGGLIHEFEGKHYMALSWIGKKELESLGFLLTGTALVPQNHYTHGKAEKFISEGHKITKDSILPEKSLLSAKDEKLNRRNHILCIYFLAEIAFMRANKGNWDKVREATRSIEMHAKRLGEEMPDELRGLLDYTNGCVAQGSGDLDQALKFFQSKTLTLRTQPASNPVSKSQKPASNHTLLDLQLLATINTAFIIRVPSHPQHAHLDRLLNLLATHFPNNNARPEMSNSQVNPSPASSHSLLSPIHSLLLSTLPNTTILQTKSLLAAALNVARRVNNVQIMSLCLTLMYDRFFRGGVQDVQAVKCAKAAGHHVRTKLGNPLWGVMSGNLEAESMALVGEDAESITSKREVVSKYWEDVPDGVKKSISRNQ